MLADVRDTGRYCRVDSILDYSQESSCMLKRWGRNESLSSFSFRCVLSKGSRAFALTVVDR